MMEQALLSSEQYPKVIIIVLNWNSWQDTVECLESLQHLAYPNYQIVVVDNGSTDSSVEKIKLWAKGEIAVESKFINELGPKPLSVLEYDRQTMKEATFLLNVVPETASMTKLVIIRNEENLGFAAGNNIGIQYALRNRAEYIWILNNDVVVTPDSLTTLVMTFKTNHEVSAVGPKVLHYDAPKVVQHAGSKLTLWRFLLSQQVGLGRLWRFVVSRARDQRDEQNSRDIRRVGFIAGIALLIDQHFLETVGLFDEDFFFYHEDAELALRARRKGGNGLFVNLDALVYHKGAQSLRRTSAQSVYYEHKYRWLVVKKYGTWYHWVIFIVAYCITQFLQFPWLIISGKQTLVVARLRAVKDFLMKRYGEFDRLRANDASRGYTNR